MPGASSFCWISARNGLIVSQRLELTGRTHQKFTAPDGDHQEVVTVKSRQAVNDEDIGAIHG